VVRFGGGGALTRIVCGKFALDAIEGPPGSLRHLPNLLHIHRKSWPQFASFSATLRLLAKEVRSAQPGSELAARFLTEVLLIQILRVLLNGPHASATGWWQALRDPPIAAALAAIHDNPGQPWSLESLAAGNVVNQIVVDEETAHLARLALDRMLALPGVGAKD